MAIFKICLLVSVFGATLSDPFFGNNYLTPQGVELVRQSNAVVSNLNSARNSLASYIRFPPTSSASLNQGAFVLVYFVGNVTQLVGNVYSELARAAGDRSTAPAVVFTKISTQFDQLEPLLQNSSLYVDELARHFDHEGDNATSNYFFERSVRMQTNANNLKQILERIAVVIQSITGQGLNTQQFLAALSTNGLLQELLDAAQVAAVASGEFADVVAKLVAAINQANSFRSTANARIQSSRVSSNNVVNSYISNSNASFNTILASTDSLFNHLKTINDSFVFRWPLLLSDRVEQKLDLLNRSIDNLSTNLHFRRGVVETHYTLMRNVFGVVNEPQDYLEDESELLTRRLTNVIHPSACVANFRTQFLSLPVSVQGQLAQCINNQLGLERQGANQVVSIANGFLRAYVTNVYNGLEICLNHPFDKMSECLNDIVDSIDFSGKFFLLDTVTFYLFEQVQSELINCNSQVVKYVQNIGLRANCQ